MKYLRSCAIALALAFLIIPAAPLGGVVPIPTVGGDALAYIDCPPTPMMDCNPIVPPPGGGVDGGGLACAASITAGAYAGKMAFNAWLLGAQTGGAVVLIGLFGFFGSLVFC